MLNVVEWKWQISLPENYINEIFIVMIMVVIIIINVWFQKISIPPHGRDFSYDPPTPLDFPKTAHKLYPSPPPEIPIFSYTPWKYFYFLFKAKN